MLEILPMILIVVVWIFVGGLVGWLFGYKAGIRKATNEARVAIGRSSFINITECTQCGATPPDHYHGCHIAADFRLMTIEKQGG